MRDTQGSWECHAGRNTAQGTQAQVKRDYSKTINLAEFAQLYLEITWDQCLFFLLSIFFLFALEYLSLLPCACPTIIFCSFPSQAHRWKDTLPPEWVLPRTSSIPDTDEGFGTFELMRFWTLSWCYNITGDVGMRWMYFAVGQMWTLVAWE